MTERTDPALAKKLDEIIDLLRHILALELSKSGVTQADIGKHLRVAKSTVVKMTKGIKVGNKTQ